MQYVRNVKVRRRFKDWVLVRFKDMKNVQKTLGSVNNKAMYVLVICCCIISHLKLSGKKIISICSWILWIRNLDMAQWGLFGFWVGNTPLTSSDLGTGARIIWRLCSPIWCLVWHSLEMGLGWDY